MDNLNVAQNKMKKLFSDPKVILVVLGAVLIVELIYAIKTLTLPTPPPPVKKASIEQSGAGKISLSTTKSVYQVSEVIPVSVIAETGTHQVNGADLIVQFDPKILEVTPTDIVKGNIFDEYPLVSVDKNKGLISISGVSSYKSGFSGIGRFAVINLKAKASGKTSLVIDFEKGSTADSNLVEMNMSEDILESVSNLELIIQ